MLTLLLSYAGAEWEDTAMQFASKHVYLHLPRH
jgi:hypothetical protein